MERNVTDEPNNVGTRLQQETEANRNGGLKVKNHAKPSRNPGLAAALEKQRSWLTTPSGSYVRHSRTLAPALPNTSCLSRTCPAHSSRALTSVANFIETQGEGSRVSSRSTTFESIMRSIKPCALFQPPAGYLFCSGGAVLLSLSQSCQDLRPITPLDSTARVDALPCQSKEKQLRNQRVYRMFLVYVASSLDC